MAKYISEQTMRRIRSSTLTLRACLHAGDGFSLHVTLRLLTIIIVQ